MKPRASTVDSVAETVRLLVRANRPMSVGELCSECEVGNAVMQRYVGMLVAKGLARAAPTPIAEGRAPRGTFYEWGPT